MREWSQAALQSGNGRTYRGEPGVGEVAAGVLGHESRRRRRFPGQGSTIIFARIMPPAPANFPWVSSRHLGHRKPEAVEAGVLAEIPVAARLGVELFYLDAGVVRRFLQISITATGLPAWATGVEKDRVKYPSGLAEISKKVHAAGMKFGLRYAPRCATCRLIGSTVPAECVAQRDGKDITLTVNDWARISQICLGNPKNRRLSQEGDGRRRRAIWPGLAEMGQLRSAGSGVQPRGPRAPGNRSRAGPRSKASTSPRGCAPHGSRSCFSKNAVTRAVWITVRRTCKPAA